MNSSLLSIAFQVALVLALIAFFRVRMRVSPRTSIFINAPLAKVFEAIDISDGRQNDYGRSRIQYALVDSANRLYNFTYTTILVGGRERHFYAQFRIAERVPEKLLQLERAGLEGKSQNNELLVIRHELSPEGQGTRLATQYDWGPRPVLAQLLARTDLWGGSHRLKGLIETGVPSERVYTMITAAIGVITGILTFGTFYLLFGTAIAIFGLIALFVHEFGHLLAYRMVGQPWGRMMFLPFLGAIAIPRLPFENQGQAVFSALMGPGFSILLAFLAIICAGFTQENDLRIIWLYFGLVVVALNLFNLMPMEPLDGGIALRPVFTATIGGYNRLGFLLSGAIITVAGLIFGQIIVTLFGFIAFVGNFKKRPVNHALAHLTFPQVALAIAAYTLVTGIYIYLYQHFNGELAPLMRTLA
jgi:Zn-dependent protease